MATASDSSGSGRSSADARRTAVGFRRGEPGAVDEVRRYVHRILAFRGLRLRAEDLPDLEQQVMTQVWQVTTRPGFDATAGFWGLVETVTARRCIDALRRARPTVDLPEVLEDGGHGPLDEVLARERTRLARRALERLESPCRELIELHALRRLSYREIAPILGKSEGALRVQMHRCVEAARRLLAESVRPSLKIVEAEERQA